jgi:endonuclease/exonuclease/phosphatase family metal-dependent hydrolase
VVAGNITSGNYQSYDPGHGIRIFQGLDPDVVLIQEFNYGDNTTADLRAMVDQAFGAEFSYYREPRGSIPNGVISRWPILQSGRWEDVDVSNRGFAWARIDIPGSRDLWAVSIHLLTSSSGDRSREAGHLVQFIERDVPGSAFLVVGGDLNTDSRTESCISTLRRVVTTQGTPVDQDGNPGTNRSRSKPYDWVLPDADLDGFRVPVTLGTNTFPNGLVFDSRVYTPLADVSPVRREDSDAPQMQHMAVVKDFLVREP